jgi:large subunit ribosomal protein L24
MASKIKKGDKVVVLTGKSKGVEGEVLCVYPKQDKVLVEGANIVKKHVKPNPDKQDKGGVIDREAPLHKSNVAIASHLKKGEGVKKYSKVGFKTLKDGNKVRFTKINDELVDIE